MHSGNCPPHARTIRAGKCVKEIEKLCSETEEGDGKLAECMSDAITESENSDDSSGEWEGGRGSFAGVPGHLIVPPLSSADAPEVSDECREEVYQFKISRNANINRNIPLGASRCPASVPVRVLHGWLAANRLNITFIIARSAAKACKVDADKFCNVTWFFGYKAGQVISCLRDVKTQVTKACKVQLFKVMMDVSALGVLSVAKQYPRLAGHSLFCLRAGCCGL